jgi:hypothetical protein
MNDDYADWELADDWQPDPMDYYEGDGDEEFYDNDPCLNCSPQCKYWLGDNLCELEIERQTKVSKEFHERFVSTVHCPICDKELSQIALPTDKLWVWPGGDWDFAGEVMLRLELFGTIYSAKGVLHWQVEEDYVYYHCWRFKEDDQFLLKLKNPRSGGDDKDEEGI